MIIDQADVLELLAQVPLFAHLSDVELNRLAGLFQIVVHRPEDVIFDVGNPSEALYVLLDGHIQLKTVEDQAFAHMRRGDVFGEEALLYDDPRYYQAIALW